MNFTKKARKLIKQLGLGKMVYAIYFKHRNHQHTIRKWGGAKNYQLILQSEQEMKRYAFNKLKNILPLNSNKLYKINFIAGEKFIHQSLFCIYSLLKVLTPEERGDFSINIYDDGTLTASTLKFLSSMHSSINIIPVYETLEHIRLRLPLSKYPYIHQKLQDFYMIKKLIYIHINNTGLNCYFDSDMLFMKKPDEFLNWLKTNINTNNTSFCINDIKRSYGYDESIIKKVWPKGITNNINAGMYAIDTEKINFDFIEALIKKFNDYGSNYYLEQLITAIILESSENLHIATKADYIVMPDKPEVQNPTAALHHYVDKSKEWYFKTAWKKVL